MNSKKMKLAFLALAVITMFSCGHRHSHSHEQQSSDSTDVQIDKQSKEYASAYICPMHCKGSGSDQPGTCPVCGMDYVVNKNYKDNHDHDGHDHDHDHDHNHD